MMMMMMTPPVDVYCLAKQETGKDCFAKLAKTLLSLFHQTLLNFSLNLCSKTEFCSFSGLEYYYAVDFPKKSSNLFGKHKKFLKLTYEGQKSNISAKYKSYLVFNITFLLNFLLLVNKKFISQNPLPKNCKM